MKNKDEIKGTLVIEAGLPLSRKGLASKTKFSIHKGKWFINLVIGIIGNIGSRYMETILLNYLYFKNIYVDLKNNFIKMFINNKVYLSIKKDPISGQ